MKALLRRRPGWVLLACIGLVALGLRGPIVAIAPAVGVLRRELGMSSAEAGLLTSIPVLCFALAAPLAALVIKRFGAELAITLTLLGVLVGVCVRSAGGAGVAMLGTVLIGLAITLGNITVPLIIRRDFPRHRHATATGVYTAALNIGSMLTSLLTAPLAGALGWRLALAASAVFIVAGAVSWVAAIGPRLALRASAPEQPHASGRPRLPGGRWIVAGLTAGFAGQAFAYYGVTAWLPTYLSEVTDMTAVQAGAGSSLFQVLAIVGGLGVPLAARRLRTATIAVVLGILWAAVPLGLLFVPGLWWLWTVAGGIAQGGGITTIFIGIIEFAHDNAAAGRISAVVQGVGYGFGALSATVVGFVHTVAGSWPAPLLVILAAVLAFAGCTTFSVRSIARRAGRERAGVPQPAGS